MPLLKGMSIIHNLFVLMTVVKTSAVVAIDATNAALGPWAGSLMSILVSLSALGAANGIIICGARYLVMHLLSSVATFLHFLVVDH